MSLRLALLLAGVVIVAAVYVWGVLRRRHRMRGHYRQRFRPFRPPEPRLTLPDDDFDDDDDPNFQISAVRIIPASTAAAEPEPAGEPAPAPAPKAKPASGRKEPAPRPAPTREPSREPAPALRMSPVEPEPEVAPQPVPQAPEPVSVMAPLANLLKRGPREPEELPVITHEPPARPERKSRKKKVDQMAFTFDGLESAESPAPPPPPPPPPQPEQQVLSLLLQAPRGKAVSGQDLMKAMNTVGLRYGDMRIFHHFGAGDLRTEVPLFSVANMFEPGYFDLDNLDAFETAGIAFFMQLPSPLDGAVAYELFLNTAQRLAEALKVELYSEPGKPLDSAAIDRMRRVAGRYAG